MTRRLALPQQPIGTGQALSPAQVKRVEDCAVKVPYSAECVARTAALALGWVGVDVQPYRCDVCTEWHLTKTRSA